MAKKEITKKIEEDWSDRGKREHQKLKPYLVLECLMQETDEKHPKSSYDIVEYLAEHYDIEAERRSILNDIKELNYVLYMLEKNCDIWTAVDDIESGDFDDEKFILFDSHPKDGGYYVNRRRFNITEDDVRLLAECVYAARFVDDKKADHLIKVISSLTNKYIGQGLKHDKPLLSRPRTLNNNVFKNIQKLNDAMSYNIKGFYHFPEKVSFRYQKLCINDIYNSVDRHNGERYKVSPYKILIDDGNYYLLALDDKSQEMRTYRVDRMADVRFTAETRDGEEEYDDIDTQNYSLRVFGMFSGTPQRVTLQFDDSLLDSVIDRFGRKGIMYSRTDECSFTVKPEVVVSPAFFAWLCSFGEKAKIIEPDSVVGEFKEYLDQIRSMY